MLRLRKRVRDGKNVHKMELQIHIYSRNRTYGKHFPKTLRTSFGWYALPLFCCWRAYSPVGLKYWDVRFELFTSLIRGIYAFPQFNKISSGHYLKFAYDFSANKFPQQLFFRRLLRCIGKMPWVFSYTNGKIATNGKLLAPVNVPPVSARKSFDTFQEFHIVDTHELRITVQIHKNILQMYVLTPNLKCIASKS